MKRIPLLLKGKKISVDMASENLAPDSDIFSLDSRLHGQGSKRQYYLKLSELPSPLLEEELRAYFEDRRQSGGGPIKCMTFNPEAHTADIYFTDSDGKQNNTLHFYNICISNLFEQLHKVYYRE